MSRTRWTRRLGELGIYDAPVVGGKNASLGVRIPDGSAVAIEAHADCPVLIVRSERQ